MNAKFEDLENRYGQQELTLDEKLARRGLNAADSRFEKKYEMLEMRYGHPKVLSSIRSVASVAATSSEPNLFSLDDTTLVEERQVKRLENNQKSKYISETWKVLTSYFASAPESEEPLESMSSDQIQGVSDADIAADVALTPNLTPEQRVERMNFCMRLKHGATADLQKIYANIPVKQVMMTVAIGLACSSLLAVGILAYGAVASGVALTTFTGVVMESMSVGGIASCVASSVAGQALSFTAGNVIKSALINTRLGGVKLHPWLSNKIKNLDKATYGALPLGFADATLADMAKDFSSTTAGAAFAMWMSPQGLAAGGLTALLTQAAKGKATTVVMQTAAKVPNLAGKAFTNTREWWANMDKATEAMEETADRIAEQNTLGVGGPGADVAPLDRGEMLAEIAAVGADVMDGVELLDKETKQKLLSNHLANNPVNVQTARNTLLANNKLVSNEEQKNLDDFEELLRDVIATENVSRRTLQQTASVNAMKETSNKMSFLMVAGLAGALAVGLATGKLEDAVMTISQNTILKQMVFQKISETVGVDYYVRKAVGLAGKQLERVQFLQQQIPIADQVQKTAYLKEFFQILMGTYMTKETLNSLKLDQLRAEAARMGFANVERMSAAELRRAISQRQSAMFKVTYHTLLMNGLATTASQTSALVFQKFAEAALRTPAEIKKMEELNRQNDEVLAQMERDKFQGTLDQLKAAAEAEQLKQSERLKAKETIGMFRREQQKIEELNRQNDEVLAQMERDKLQGALDQLKAAAEAEQLKQSQRMKAKEAIGMFQRKQAAVEAEQLKQSTRELRLRAIAAEQLAKETEARLAREALEKARQVELQRINDQFSEMLWNVKQQSTLDQQTALDTSMKNLLNDLSTVTVGPTVAPNLEATVGLGPLGPEEMLETVVPGIGKVLDILSDPRYEKLFEFTPLLRDFIIDMAAAKVGYMTAAATGPFGGLAALAAFYQDNAKYYNLGHDLADAQRAIHNLNVILESVKNGLTNTNQPGLLPEGAIGPQPQPELLPEVQAKLRFRPESGWGYWATSRLPGPSDLIPEAIKGSETIKARDFVKNILMKALFEENGLQVAADSAANQILMGDGYLASASSYLVGVDFGMLSSGIADFTKGSGQAIKGIIDLAQTVHDKQSAQAAVDATLEAEDAATGTSLFGKLKQVDETVDNVVLGAGKIAVGATFGKLTRLAKELAPDEGFFANRQFYN
jgi:hypothetical protein